MSADATDLRGSFRGETLPCREALEILEVILVLADRVRSRRTKPDEPHIGWQSNSPLASAGRVENIERERLVARLCVNRDPYFAGRPCPRCIFLEWRLMSW